MQTNICMLLHKKSRNKLEISTYNSEMNMSKATKKYKWVKAKALQPDNSVINYYVTKTSKDLTANNFEASQFGKPAIRLSRTL